MFQNYVSVPKNLSIGFTPRALILNHAALQQKYGFHIIEWISQEKLGKAGVLQDCRNNLAQRLEWVSQSGVRGPVPPPWLWDLEQVPLRNGSSTRKERAVPKLLGASNYPAILPIFRLENALIFKICPLAEPMAQAKKHFNELRSYSVVIKKVILFLPNLQIIMEIFLLSLIFKRHYTHPHW